MAQSTYTLTVDTAKITGEAFAGLGVSVWVTEPVLVKAGSPEEIIVPDLVGAITNARGICSFELLASSVVGTYSIQLGKFEFRFNMPARDVGLVELAEEGQVSLPSLASGLPPVSDADDGKVLAVVGGVWAAVDEAEAVGGIRRVASDETLIGDGTSGSLLRVARPFTGTATDQTARDAAVAAQRTANGKPSQADIDTAIATKVSKSGDTMTGKLTLDGAPTNNLHAATKKYVDDRGGTGEDATARAAAAAAQTTADAALPKTGGTMSGKIILDGNPTENLHAATKQYVDDNAGGGGGGEGAALSDSTPIRPNDNAGAAGTANRASRSDHKHPLPALATRSSGGLMSSADKQRADKVTDIEHRVSDLRATAHDSWADLPNGNAAAFRMTGINNADNLRSQGWGHRHQALLANVNYVVEMRIPRADSLAQYRLTVDDALDAPNVWSEGEPDATYRYFGGVGTIQVARNKFVEMQKSSRSWHTTYDGDLSEAARDRLEKELELPSDGVVQGLQDLTSGLHVKDAPAWAAAAANQAELYQSGRDDRTAEQLAALAGSFNPGIQVRTGDRLYARSQKLPARRVRVYAPDTAAHQAYTLNDTFWETLGKVGDWEYYGSKDTLTFTASTRLIAQILPDAAHTEFADDVPEVPARTLSPISKKHFDDNVGEAFQLGMITTRWIKDNNARTMRFAVVPKRTIPADATIQAVIGSATLDVTHSGFLVSGAVLSVDVDAIQAAAITSSIGADTTLRFQVNIGTDAVYRYIEAGSTGEGTKKKYKNLGALDAVNFSKVPIAERTGDGNGNPYSYVGGTLTGAGLNEQLAYSELHDTVIRWPVPTTHGRIGLADFNLLDNAGRAAINGSRFWIANSGRGRITIVKGGIARIFPRDDVMILPGGVVECFLYMNPAPTVFSSGGQIDLVVTPHDEPESFVGLTDTPARYTGQKGKILEVNAGETGMAFVDKPAGVAVAPRVLLAENLSRALGDDFDLPALNTLSDYNHIEMFYLDGTQYRLSLAPISLLSWSSSGGRSSTISIGPAMQYLPPFNRIGVGPSDRLIRVRAISL